MENSPLISGEVVTTSPLIIGEFWISFLYRQDYLATDHRQVDSSI